MPPERGETIDTATARPWARFDDLIGGRAWVFPAADRVLVAEEPCEVAGVLQQVEAASRDGHWAFGYVAYEAAAGLADDLPVHPAAAPLGMPLVWFGICGRPRPVEPLQPRDPDDSIAIPDVAWTADTTQHAHAVGVEAVRAAIAAGECYQCNLTMALTGQVRGDPAELYRDLALGQRGAYNAYLDLGRHVVASASPELFFERRGDQILLRPMKGTSRRGRFGSEDTEFAAELRASEKERAENVMIVDLMRNDVARVARTGSVHVPHLWQVEWYETVLQLTSDVTAELRPGLGLLELFTALFPSGSVTGAPKRRSMALLRDLEAGPRGVYCGAVGMVAPESEPVQARFSVAIRTVAIDVSTGQARYGTGSGITWDSRPEAEYAEVQAKSAVLAARPKAYQLLETMYFDGRAVVNLERHLARMAASAAHLGFAFASSAATAALRAELVRPEPARVRLLLHRGGEIDVESGPAPARGGALTLGVDDDPVDPAEWWLYHKTTLREPYERRRLSRPDLDDMIMVNLAGELTEATRASLAVKLDGTWWTPPVTGGCLPGVERSRLLDERVLRERTLHRDDLAVAEGVAVVSSLRGWRDARVEISHCGTY